LYDKEYDPTSEINMKRLLVALFLILGILPFNTKTSSSKPLPPQPESDEHTFQDATVHKAIYDAAIKIRDERYPIPLYDIDVDNLVISDDGKWASAWIIMLHLQTAEVIASEPGYAIAQWDGSTWQVSFPTDSRWESIIVSTPPEVVSDDIKSFYLSENIAIPELLPSAPIGGFLLPWEFGRTVYLSRSLQHDYDITSGSAHYSFDFYVPQTMFNIHASKPGTVWLYKDTVPNNDHSDVNYLVLQDAQNPTLYQLYLHLAQDSIPPGLKLIGAPVAQGQFIGVADNTGYSTGHHLHFQVQEAPHWNGYWGQSVDITFSDVDINGGRPRVAVDLPYCQSGDVCDEIRSSYVSGNFPPDELNAPVGDITFPDHGILVDTNTLNLSGWAIDDDSGLFRAQFKANYDNTWHLIGPSFNTSQFSFAWDMCSDQVPDGPVSLALDLMDNDSNIASGLPGLRHFIKNYTCPTPASNCNPNENQVALYTDPNYGGACVTLNPGSYDSSSFGALGNDQAESIKVGTNVMATVYKNPGFTGRGQTFFNSDRNISDDFIGDDTISAVKIQSRTASPSPPTPIWPADGAAFSEGVSLSLVWDDGGGANEYIVEWNGSSSGQSWQRAPVFHLGSLSAGSFTWRVKARNNNGESAWSALQNMNIQATTPGSIPSYTAPYSDNMEATTTDWSDYNWDRTSDYNHTSGGAKGWLYDVGYDDGGYDTGEPNSGDLTSPKINIPSSGTYYLRFWSQYETEDAGINWDQRWVQISTDAGPFKNILQLSDDPPNFWTQSPAIDLSDFAGSTIQVRFHFETLDTAFNDYKGWIIDDFSINSTPPPSCIASGEPDNTPGEAQVISYNSSTDAEICPGGDVDFYTFAGNSGDQIGIATESKNIGSLLDTYISLLDSSGKSVLSENDDLVYAKHTDSYLSYVLPYDGTYIIKVKPWNHPSVGGDNYYYTLHLNSNDTIDPEIEIISPPDSTFLPNGNAMINADATDTGSGISHVAFYWHSGDWQYSGWTFLDLDRDGSDGWKFEFDTTAISDQKEIAFYAITYDLAGNTRSAGSWNLWLDRTPPVTQIQPAPNPISSTLIEIQWTGQDNLSGIDQFDLQRQIGAGSWADAVTGIDGDIKKTWVVGEMGNTYGFRLRGIDRIGNTENYPSNAELTVSIDNMVCTSGDPGENDNDPGTANVLSGLSIRQNHNFCNPVHGSGWLNDVDWFSFSLESGQRVSIQSDPGETGSASILRLYDTDAITLLTESVPSQLGKFSSIEYYAAQDKDYYIQVSPLDGGITGDTATYELWVRKGNPLYLPLINLGQ
jgi:hypothetical protein